MEIKREYYLNKLIESKEDGLIKINEINIANNWNSKADNPKEMGGFNFGTKDKILRWLHRGDTIYDVIIPKDAELIEVDSEKGIYRANKIIVINPRKITDDLILELAEKSTLNNKLLAQSFQVLLWRNHLEACKKIIIDKVNRKNIDEIFEEYVKYTSNGDVNYDFTTGISSEIYKMLLGIRAK